MRLFLPLALAGTTLALSGELHSEKLVPALRARAQAQLEDEGIRAGAAGLSTAMRSGERARILAAAMAAPSAEDGWALLGQLSRLAARPDRSIAVAAAHSSVLICHQLDPIELERQEVPAASLARWQDEWVELGASKKHWIDLRVQALEVAACLDALSLPANRAELPWPNFVGDVDPVMRRAAVELAPDRPPLLSLIKARLMDETKEVALAAGQWLCSSQEAESHAASLTQAETTRLVELSREGSLPIATRVDLAPCLRYAATPESELALAALRKGASTLLDAKLGPRASRP